VPAQEMPPVLPVGPAPVPADNATASSANTTEGAASQSPSGGSAPASEDAAPPATAAPAVEPNAHSEQAKPVRVANAEATDSSPRVGNEHSFAVQLAAPQTEAQARQSMAKLQKDYGAEISRHRLKYRRATVANKSVYRVRVVGLSHEEANALCKKVQAKGGSCFVARND
jgi:hypothetical protein